ncbi:ser-3 [Pristionchus pacificus]|uniref:Ser-3 n=1 Tax=Pristionchus pacificus TaxID=54126 RepID=A0A2A6CC52_PRIPA|nr:ser-3 [Pristionchus pacificus]|eukprot:PDM75754.1 ser-3 [Pristionchus pacificus]
MDSSEVDTRVFDISGGGGLDHYTTQAPTNSSVGPQCSFYEWSRLPQTAGLLRIFSTISVLTVLVVIVVLGNSLVIAAVLLRRRLRSATGLLILSLGVADLLVGTVILPFSIANEVLAGYWIFGETWCTIWLTMDIWMCTASIYNLVAISIDRYIAIIKPLNYPMLVTKFRARCIVAFVWVLSFIICTPSFILASTDKPVQNSDSTDPAEGCKCTPSHAGYAYIIFSASASFYLPMAVVIFVYARIYIAARNATKSVYSGMMQVSANANKNAKSYLMSHPSALGGNREAVPMLRVHRGSSVAAPRASDERTRRSVTPLVRAPGVPEGSPAPPVPRCSPNGNARSNSCGMQSTPMKKIVEREKASTDADSSSPHSSPTRTITAPLKTLEVAAGNGAAAACNNLPPWIADPKPDKRRLLDRSILKKGPLGRLLKKSPKKKAGCAYEKRLSLEIKAAKTVAIVTGCFIFCWLGFAILYGFQIKTSEVLWSILFWLGYLNSALNPVIYTVFNREFRICFKRLLTCHRVNQPSTKATGTTASSTTGYAVVQNKCSETILYMCEGQALKCEAKTALAESQLLIITHSASRLYTNNNSYNSTVRGVSTLNNKSSGGGGGVYTQAPPPLPVHSSPAHLYQYDSQGTATVKIASTDSKS